MNAKETREVRYALDLLEEAISWLRSDQIEICRVGDNTTLAYTNKDGRTLGTINKNYGSRLQCAELAAHNLRRLLETRGYHEMKAAKRMSASATIETD